jgi:hypothetical protein
LLFAKNSTEFDENLQNALVAISENTVAADTERQTDGLAATSATDHPPLATSAQK